MKSLRYAANAAALALLFLTAPAHGGTADAAQSGAHALSAADLEGFLAPLMEQQLTGQHVAGAVAVAVKDGTVLFAKGYGLADIEAKRAMTADATLVRPGSISKLFTAISVMQLVEQGKLDLDRDVNGYLDFRIPVPEGGVPVTLRRLLTHRAGFEEHVKDLFSSKPIPEPLGRWLAHSQPKRLFPAGECLCLLQLRHRACRLHRRAGQRRALRRLCRPAYSCAPRHEPLHIRATHPKSARPSGAQDLPQVR
jgi:CubicO group peptidase (beta-lactamase class C family)